MDKIDTVNRFISSLLSSDRATAATCLSGKFGRHDGVDAEGYLDRELEEFRARRHWFEGDQFQIKVIETVQNATEYTKVRFFVLDHLGEFVYEDCLAFDLLAQIRGNQKIVECVSKVFVGSDGPCRQLAIRSPGNLIRNVRIPGIVADIDLHDGANMDEDGFQVITIRIANDDMRERYIPIRFLLESKADGSCVQGQEVVLLRGIDHPVFTNMAPRIEGNTVHLPAGKLRVWSLACFDADGKATIYEYPATGQIRHFSPVARAILTDALDNDWEVEACNDTNP